MFAPSMFLWSHSQVELARKSLVENSRCVVMDLTFFPVALMSLSPESILKCVASHSSEDQLCRKRLQRDR